MKIKLLIIFLFLNTLLCCGCEINNLNKSTPTKLTISDINQLIGVTYDDVEKIYGSPEKSTYYIRLKDLSNINRDYISLRTFNYHCIIKAYYNINNRDSYIILWYKNNKVIKSSFDESDVINKDYFSFDISSMDIKMDYNKNASCLNKNLTVDKFKNYVGSNIKELNNKYNLICPKIAVNLLNKDKILYFYDFKDENDNTDKTNSLFIITSNNIVVKTTIIDSNKVCETILTYSN